MKIQYPEVSLQVFRAAGGGNALRMASRNTRFTCTVTSKKCPSSYYYYTKYIWESHSSFQELGVAAVEVI